MSNKNKRIGIYPGTFDPITLGHMHIIKRASKLVDKLVIGVAANKNKNPLFDQQERAALIKKDLENLDYNSDCEILVEDFDQLLVDFAADMGAVCIFRGLRAVSDFDYEFQMTGMNLHLAYCDTSYPLSQRGWFNSIMTCSMFVRCLVFNVDRLRHLASKDVHLSANKMEPSLLAFLLKLT